MALNPLSGAGGPAGIAGAGTSPRVGGGAESFGKVLRGQTGPRENAPIPVRNEPVPQQAQAAPNAVPGVARAEATAAVGAPAATRAQAAAKVLDQVTAAQQRMDHILELAESGKSFSPAELISLQAHVYRASQELDLAGKVVEKATGGVKQVLQTQL